MSEEIVLKTEDLTKHYGGVHALEGANFELKKRRARSYHGRQWCGQIHVCTPDYWG